MFGIVLTLHDQQLRKIRDRYASILIKRKLQDDIGQIFLYNKWY